MKRLSILALFFAACDQAEQSELTAAYEEAVVQTRSSETVSDVAAPRQLGAPVDPLMFFTDLEAFMSAESDCASISQSGESITIDFGEEGCAYLDRSLTGSISATIAESDSGTAIAMELFDLSDGVVTLTGTADASISDAARELLADLHISHDADADPACRGDEERPEEGMEGEERPEDEERPEGEEMGDEERPEGEEGRPEGGDMRPPAEVDMIGSRSEAPLDGSFESGVIVNGSRQMSAEEGDATMTETDLEIVAGELVPQAGTIVHDGPRGLVTMTFSRVDASAIQIDIEGERGSESFQVDPVSGERL